MAVMTLCNYLIFNSDGSKGGLYEPSKKALLLGCKEIATKMGKRGPMHFPFPDTRFYSKMMYECSGMKKICNASRKMIWYASSNIASSNHSLTCYSLANKTDTAFEQTSICSYFPVIKRDPVSLDCAIHKEINHLRFREHRKMYK